MADEARHTYRIEVRVPRVLPRPGNETTWRTLAPPDRIEHALEVADHLRESLVASGLFDDDLVADWFAHNVRLVEYRTTVERVKEMPLRVTEYGMSTTQPG